MSYDLFFRSGKPLSVAKLRKYFAALPNMYMSDDRAGYENETTGIYFGFDFSEEEKEDEGRVPVAFNVNYFRPHTFGLEAEPVLSAFVEELGLEIDDPQSDGMGEGPYSPEGFLRGWNAGNRFAYQAIMSGDSAPEPLTLPSARNEAIWRWNFAKDDTTEHMYDLIGEAPPCFIPTIMLVQTTKGGVQSLVVWDATMAIAIPDVDLVLTPVEGGGSLVGDAREVLDLVNVHSTWDSDYEPVDGKRVGLPTRLVDEVGDALSKKIKAAMKPVDGLRRIPSDQVLDAELVAAALRAK